MPANMISAPVGSSLAVTGSSSATVSAGPDTRQHADRRAERDADESPHEIREGKRDAEPGNERAEGVHVRRSRRTGLRAGSIPVPA